MSEALGKVLDECYPIRDRLDPKADLHNSHVYLYFRYLGWESEQQNKHMAAFFYRDFARQELGIIP